MSALEKFSKDYLHPYVPPSWAENLKGIPTNRLKLANLSTPIQRWDLPGTPEGFEVYIKRDDMTGITLSGNKVRKLEFILADAIKKGYSDVIASGRVQSNQCRTTAVACREVGLKPHLILALDPQISDQIGCDGNAMLDRLCGAEFYVPSCEFDQDDELQFRMEKLADTIRTKSGKKAYVVPVTGFDVPGFWGYLNLFQELLHQGLTEHFDDIVLACGGGETLLGLAVGNYLTDSKLKIHGPTVFVDSDYLYRRANEGLRELGLEQVCSEDLFDILENYKGGSITQNDLDYSVEVASKTGIMVDPTYTLKGTRALVSEMQNNPGRFKGRRILYIHTGGLFGMFDGRLNETLKKPGSVSNSVHMWLDKNSPPF